MRAGPQRDDIALAAVQTGQAGSTVALPRSAGLSAHLRLPRARILQSPRAALLSLGVLFGCTLLVVIYATAGPSILVSKSDVAFPGWLAGPLGGLFGPLPHHVRLLNAGFSLLLVLMTAAYLVTLAAARSLTMRAIWVFVIAAAVVLVLCPPLQYTDLFNYLGYAHLGALHHLNPYTHVIGAEQFDPVARLATWGNWRSPYGTLFSALTYPLALMPLPVAYWVLKVVTVALSVVFIWLVYRCALLLDRDPRLPVLFVAANPVYLIYAVAEFHNDFFMLVPSMGAIALLLARRYRWAGVAIAVAIAVKYTMVLLVPFLIFAAWRRHGLRRLLSGIVLAGIPLVVMSVALFGFTVGNVHDQSRLITDLSIPNLLGWALGAGGAASWVVNLMQVVIVGVVVYQIFRKRDWLSGAGWATVALLASLGWLMPWYIIWLLPLAAIAADARLRVVALGATLLVTLSFMPVVLPFLKHHGINPMSGSVGVNAVKFQRLAQSDPLGEVR
jgi:glycosyl transferase family 87